VRRFKVRRVDTELAPAAVGTYSQGVVFGNVCYFSGQIGLNPKTMEMSDSFSDQLKQILENIDGLLKSEGLTKTDIIKTTIFLTSLKDFGMVNDAYSGYFSEPYPARSCVEVSALPKGAKVEIEVIASKK
jgi:2-iminobutanoate/2-iminopropanoate deaminase